MPGYLQLGGREHRRVCGLSSRGENQVAPLKTAAEKTATFDTLSFLIIYPGILPEAHMQLKGQY